jgi:hypothetical protein
MKGAARLVFPPAKPPITQPTTSAENAPQVERPVNVGSSNPPTPVPRLRTKINEKSDGHY